jgi:PleD family two-component response regulator
MAVIGRHCDRGNGTASSAVESAGTETFETVVDGLAATHTPFAVALVRIDHFAVYRRQHGAAASAAVHRFVDVASGHGEQHHLATGDHDGEWFVVLPYARTDDAVAFCNQLRRELAMSFADDTLPPFTVSAGVVDTDEAHGLDDLAAMAERAVGYAVAAGCDLVVRARAIDGEREHELRARISGD